MDLSLFRLNCHKNRVRLFSAVQNSQVAQHRNSSEGMKAEQYNDMVRVTS